MTGSFYDASQSILTTNYFEGNIDLEAGTNLITLHATDDAGNTNTMSLTLDYAEGTNPPSLGVIWPQDGEPVGGTSFTLQAQVDSSRDSITASVNGTTAKGLVEQNGLVWVYNLPLAAGTNSVTLTASNALGEVSTTNFNVIGNDVGLVVNPLTSDQMNQPTVTVTGFIPDPADDWVVVNGVMASPIDDVGDWEANVPVTPTGTADILVEVYTGDPTKISSLTLNPPQPPMVVLIGYSGYVRQFFPNAFNGLPSLAISTVNWTADSGGSSPTTGYAPNDIGSIELPLSSNVTIPPDDPGFSTLDQDDTVLPLTFRGSCWDQSSVNAGNSQRVTGAKFGLISQGQQPAGMTNITLLYVTPAALSDPDFSGIGQGAGDLPVSPEIVKLNGQPLANSGITNDDGTIKGLMAVVNKAGEVTPVSVDSPLPSVNLNSIVASNLTLQIVDTNTGFVFSDQTTNVIVGQQINLTCQLGVTNALFSNSMLSNFQWTIPGYAISNYIVASDTSTATLETNFPTTNSTAVFYWVDGANNRTVQCSATIGGVTKIVQAVFNVIRPLPQFYAPVIGAIAVDTNFNGFFLGNDGDIIDNGVMGGTWLHFGNPNSWTNVGIAFSFSNAPSFVGRYFLVQIVNESDVKMNLLEGTNLIGQEDQSFGLDTEYPYQATNDFWHLGGYSYLQNDRWLDCPASFLESNSVTWLSRTDSFTMYLMFQASTPDYSNNIPVPMYSATWSWSGTAKTNNSPAGFYLYSSSPPSPNVAPTLNFPLWTTNSQQSDFETTTPFNEN